MLKQTVTFEDGLVKRSFEDEYIQTSFGHSLQCMKKLNEKSTDKIANAFYKIHENKIVNLKNLNETISFFFDDPYKYYRAQPVHWFWGEFYNAILKNYLQNEQNNTFWIRIKACSDYYFYTLEGLGKDDANPQLLHEPFFRKATPPAHKDGKNYEEDARGIADTILLLAPQLEQKNAEEVVNTLRWFDIYLEMTVETYDETCKKMKFAIKPTISHTKHISLPPDPNHHTMLVTSPVVRNALEKLTDVWFNKSATAVLLSAAPGSGKEVLQKFLVNALRLNPEQKLELSAAELGTYKALKDELYKHAAKTKQALRDKECENSNLFMLFLDEIHHDAASDLRSGLLRIMETGIKDLVLKSNDSNEEIKLPYKRILFVLAASKPVEELRKIHPLDLWTRIDHTVVQKHPLSLYHDAKNRKEVLMDYFYLFWMGECKTINKFPGLGQNHILCNGKLSSGNFVENPDLVDMLSDRFAEQVGSPLIPVISMRVLRNIIRRLKSKTESYLRMHPSLTSVEEINKSIEKDFDRWVFDIFYELAPQLSHEGIF